MRGARPPRPNFHAAAAASKFPPCGEMAAATTKEVWGPPLWRLLHSLAERLGRQTIPLLVMDEKRAWISSLKAVGQVMPCLACRNHFREWSGRRRLEQFANTHAIRDTAREWLWALHSEVNASRGVTGPPLDQMPDLYGRRTSQELNEDYKAVTTAFQAAVAQRLIPPEAFMNFKMRIVALRQLTG